MRVSALWKWWTKGKNIGLNAPPYFAKIFAKICVFLRSSSERKGMIKI